MQIRKQNDFFSKKTLYILNHMIILTSCYKPVYKWFVAIYGKICKILRKNAFKKDLCIQ